jgi:hypothetical protein
LHYAAGAHGTVSGATSQTVDSGRNGTVVVAVPSRGYGFVRWSDGVVTASRADAGVSADHNVTAIFAPYGLSTPKASGKVSSKSKITVGGSVTPAAHGKVTVTVYRLVKKKYRKFRAYSATLSASSRWALKVRLGKGTWYVRSSYGGRTSAYGRIKVKR